MLEKVAIKNKRAMVEGYRVGVKQVLRVKLKMATMSINMWHLQRVSHQLAIHVMH